METIADRIEQRVREWGQWSRAERRNMGAIIEEVVTHCRQGTGNTFIREWCTRNLSDMCEETERW